MSEEFEQYQKQLVTVERALLYSSDPVEKKSLESLKDDLKELLELTKETDSTRNETENGKDDSSHDEMAIFMKEIVEAGGNSLDTTLEELKAEMESRVGEKCSAPHCHSWGNTIYHNAIICGVDEVLEGFSASLRARVLFTNPTHKEMIPCSYYFEGECKFENDKCHFSHGESIAFEDLKEYKEPQFEKLSRNCVVLAKMKDRMWYKGRVLCSNFVDKNCRVRLESNKNEMDFNFEDLFPIFHDDELSSGSSDESEKALQSDVEFSKRTHGIEANLFSYAPNQSLGQWEKHTKGIGSKLMFKMGYIAGTGLGWNGEGIVTPISVQIMPPGRSLDYCMELREAAKGDRDLFNVEKKLVQCQKRQEILNAKAYTRECKKKDVFSFLNGTLLATQHTTNHLKAPAFPSYKNNYHNHSTKKLNVESVRIADDIRKKEREVSQIKESISRHHEESDVHNRLKAQLEAKNQELVRLKKCESSLAKEQMSRKTKDKLTFF